MAQPLPGGMLGVRERAPTEGLALSVATAEPAEGPEADELQRARLRLEYAVGVGDSTRIAELEALVKQLERGAQYRVIALQLDQANGQRRQLGKEVMRLVEARAGVQQDALSVAARLAEVRMRSVVEGAHYGGVPARVRVLQEQCMAAETEVTKLSNRRSAMTEQLQALRTQAAQQALVADTAAAAAAGAIARETARMREAEENLRRVQTEWQDVDKRLEFAERQRDQFAMEVARLEAELGADASEVRANLQTDVGAEGMPTGEVEALGIKNEELQAWALKVTGLAGEKDILTRSVADYEAKVAEAAARIGELREPRKLAERAEGAMEAALMAELPQIDMLNQELARAMAMLAQLQTELNSAVAMESRSISLRSALDGERAALEEEVKTALAAARELGDEAAKMRAAMMEMEKREEALLVTQMRIAADLWKDREPERFARADADIRGYAANLAGSVKALRLRRAKALMEKNKETVAKAYEERLKVLKAATQGTQAAQRTGDVLGKVGALPGTPADKYAAGGQQRQGTDNTVTVTDPVGTRLSRVGGAPLYAMMPPGPDDSNVYQSTNPTRLLPPMTVATLPLHAARVLAGNGTPGVHRDPLTEAVRDGASAARSAAQGAESQIVGNREGSYVPSAEATGAKAGGAVLQENLYKAISGETMKQFPMVVTRPAYELPTEKPGVSLNPGAQTVLEQMHGVFSRFATEACTILEASFVKDLLTESAAAQARAARAARAAHNDLVTRQVIGNAVSLPVLAFTAMTFGEVAQRAAPHVANAVDVLRQAVAPNIPPELFKLGMIGATWVLAIVFDQLLPGYNNPMQLTLGAGAGSEETQQAKGQPITANGRLTLTGPEDDNSNLDPTEGATNVGSKKNNHGDMSSAGRASRVVADATMQTSIDGENEAVAEALARAVSSMTREQFESAVTWSMRADEPPTAAEAAQVLLGMAASDERLARSPHNQRLLEDAAMILRAGNHTEKFVELLRGQPIGTGTYTGTNAEPVPMPPNLSPSTATGMPREARAMSWWEHFQAYMGRNQVYEQALAFRHSSDRERQFFNAAKKEGGFSAISRKRVNPEEGEVDEDPVTRNVKDYAYETQRGLSREARKRGQAKEVR